MRKFALALTFLAFVLLSGCVGQQQLQPEGFAGGENGLKMEFLNNTPPDTIFKGVPFEVALFIENAGETLLEPNSIHLKFGNAKNFNVPAEKETITIPTNTEGPLEGKHRAGDQLVGGGKTIVYYDASYTGILPPTEKAPVSFSIQACYQYATKGVSNLCIARTTDVCDPLAQKEMKSSGGPIQFTDFSEVSTAKGNDVTVQFEFTVKNTGGGSVYDVACEEIGNRYDNQISITSLRFGTEDLLPICKTNNKVAQDSDWIVSLDKDGVGKGVCTFRTTLAGGDYKDLIFMTVAYTYVQDIQKEVSVIPLQL